VKHGWPKSRLGLPATERFFDIASGLRAFSPLRLFAIGACRRATALNAALLAPYQDQATSCKIRLPTAIDEEGVVHGLLVVGAAS